MAVMLEGEQGQVGELQTDESDTSGEKVVGEDF